MTGVIMVNALCNNPHAIHFKAMLQALYKTAVEQLTSDTWLLFPH